MTTTLATLRSVLGLGKAPEILGSVEMILGAVGAHAAKAWLTQLAALCECLTRSERGSEDRRVAMLRLSYLARQLDDQTRQWTATETELLGAVLAMAGTWVEDWCSAYVERKS